MTVNTRDITIDIAKGIGILLVVLGHLNNPIQHYIYAFHMPLFFFLSGMFARNNSSFKNMINRKMKSLLMPFLFYYVVSILYKTIKLVIEGRLTIYDFSLYNMDSVFYKIGPIWFLIALFYDYILWLLISRLSRISKVIISVFLLIIPLSYYEMNPCYICSALLGFPFFVIGNIVAHWTLEKMRTINVSRVLISSVCSILLLITVSPPPDNSLSANTIQCNWLQFLTAGLSGIILTISISIYIKNISCKTSALFSKIGVVSIHIMAQHMYFLIFISQCIVFLTRSYVNYNLYDSYFWNFIFFIISVPTVYWTSKLSQRYIFSKLLK